MKIKLILLLSLNLAAGNTFAQGFSHSFTGEGELKVSVVSEDSISGSLDIKCDETLLTVIINGVDSGLGCNDISKISVTGSQQPDNIDLSQVKKSAFKTLGTTRIDAHLGDDTIKGSEVRDVINAGIGNDTVYAGAGNDQVSGESGDDVIYGEAGNDKLIGDSGNDKLYGGPGNDNLSGDSGNDLLDGGPGKDKGSVGSGKDRTRGLENNSRKLPRLPPGFSL